MSDIQSLTIALPAGPTMLAVLVGILINNEVLDARLKHIEDRG